MMRSQLFLLILFFIFFSFSNCQRAKDTNGVLCAACSITIRSIQLESLKNKKNITTIIKDFCMDKFKGTVAEKACVFLMDIYGEALIELLVQNFPPDDVCRFIKLCKAKHCNLIKNKINQKPSDELRKKLNQLPDFTDWWKFIKEQIIDRIFEHRKPVVDFDNDGYSKLPYLRGYYWRGKDCNDMLEDIYPGRKISSYKPDVDHNCNGIYGVNEKGIPYENIFCSGPYAPKGIAILGDSASARFHIPIIEGEPINFKKLLNALLNEADYPQCSWSTGFLSTKECPKAANIEMDSIYLQLRKRNKCMHRDYQNISVNGARSSAMQTKIVKALSRNQTSDNPLIVFYSLSGNDVCNPHPGGDRMTTPQDFEDRITKTLLYLDTILPNGSFVFFTGLFEGELMWEYVGSKRHMLNVTYADLWDYISCLEVNPCWGWLNKNATWRDFTTKRARALNAVFPKIVANQKYKNFKVAYLGTHFKDNLEKWKAMGGDPSEFFEVVDGGHPSQLAHAFMARSVWKELETKYPHVIGPINPYNEQIEKLFGDQGGY